MNLLLLLQLSSLNAAAVTADAPIDCNTITGAQIVAVTGKEPLILPKRPSSIVPWAINACSSIAQDSRCIPDIRAFTVCPDTNKWQKQKIEKFDLYCPTSFCTLNTEELEVISEVYPPKITDAEVAQQLASPSNVIAELDHDGTPPYVPLKTKIETCDDIDISNEFINDENGKSMLYDDDTREDQYNMTLLWSTTDYKKMNICAEHGAAHNLTCTSDPIFQEIPKPHAHHGTRILIHWQECSPLSESSKEGTFCEKYLNVISDDIHGLDEERDLNKLCHKAFNDATGTTCAAHATEHNTCVEREENCDAHQLKHFLNSDIPIQVLSELCQEVDDCGLNEDFLHPAKSAPDSLCKVRPVPVNDCEDLSTAYTSLASAVTDELCGVFGLVHSLPCKAKETEDGCEPATVEDFKVDDVLTRQASGGSTTELMKDLTRFTDVYTKEEKADAVCGSLGLHWYRNTADVGPSCSLENPGPTGKCTEVNVTAESTILANFEECKKHGCDYQLAETTCSEYDAEVDGTGTVTCEHHRAGSTSAEQECLLFGMAYKLECNTPAVAGLCVTTEAEEPAHACSDYTFDLLVGELTPMTPETDCPKVSGLPDNASEEETVVACFEDSGDDTKLQCTGSLSNFIFASTVFGVIALLM